MVWLSLALLVIMAPASAARADYVRDEIRINMRTGPGVNYRIVQLLASGDQVTRLGEKEDWTQVRTPAGEEGWVPSTYLSSEPPPSVQLPDVTARLRKTGAHARELEEQLKAQAREVVELEGLRERVKKLESDNVRLSNSTRWKDFASGGTIVLIGMLIGSLLPRGGRQRTRRLKL